MLRIGAGRTTALALALAVASCGSTVDSVGYNSPSGITLKPLAMRDRPPNTFGELGRTDQEITAKIVEVFTQLFHGDPKDEAIYKTIGTDQAEIRDILHDDVRTEGLGWGMMIAVQLDRRDEFDRLWTYAKAQNMETEPPAKGYFNSWCGADPSGVPCLDPFGMQQFVTALLFAHDRWAATPGKIDYGAAAVELLYVFRHQRDINGGIRDGVTDVFDPDTALPYATPEETAVGQISPSGVMPGYYELWAEATGDSFWSRAAASGRAFWQRAAHPETGLFPVRATLVGAMGGSPFGTFQPEAYRVELNLAIDALWFEERDPWRVEEANHLLKFFTHQGFKTYGTSFTVDGKKVLNPDREPALILMNGAVGAVSTNGDRLAYVQEVWDMQPPTGNARYYSGLVQILSLMVLGGQFLIY